MGRAAAAAPVHPPSPHDTLANTLADMLAKVLTLCLLVSLTLAATRSKAPKSVKRADHADDGLGSYKTVEARLLEGVKLRRGPSYLVPAGQCNVTLSPELCGEGLVVASLEVALQNPARQYAEVVFEMRDKHRVRVELDNCPQPWSLDLRLACLRQKPSRSHSRVPLLLDP